MKTSMPGIGDGTDAGVGIRKATGARRSGPLIAIFLIDPGTMAVVVGRHRYLPGVVVGENESP